MLGCVILLALIFLLTAQVLVRLIEIRDHLRSIKIILSENLEPSEDGCVWVNIGSTDYKVKL